MKLTPEEFDILIIHHTTKRDVLLASAQHEKNCAGKMLKIESVGGFGWDRAEQSDDIFRDEPLKYRPKSPYTHNQRADIFEHKAHTHNQRILDLHYMRNTNEPL